MLDQYMPGTNIPFSAGNTSDTIEILIRTTNGLSLSQVCTITGLETSTIQNWVKRGYVSRPVKKKYFDRQIWRILLISSLRDCMKIEEIAELMSLINGDVEDASDDIISEARLYDYFCQAIKQMDTHTLNEETISDIVDSLLSDFDHPGAAKLSCAIKIMVYAYISGRCQKEINRYLRELKGE
ncbi:MAG: DUF1836 domain-containing protein [Erysipelotrichaceae bacterium]|nr:DUF1836 domain-containing protein [Erysipelotrichaceae bacterium]